MPGEYMKIIGIVGILDFPQSEDRVWKNLRLAFAEQFPSADFCVEHALYLPWQTKKISSFADSILEKHDSGGDVLLLGYSTGGIIACEIAREFEKSRVRAVVTICAPHKIPRFNTIRPPRSATLQMPVLTFAGLFDPFVFFGLSTHPDGVHTNLMTDHLFWFFLSKRPAMAVAQRTRRFLTAFTPAQPNG